MTRLVRCLTLALLVIVGWVAGCHQCERSEVLWRYPNAECETLGQTSEEHYQSVRRIKEHERKALNEDLDLLFQTNRPTRLTQWHDK